MAVVNLPPGTPCPLCPPHPVLMVSPHLLPHPTDSLLPGDGGRPPLGLWQRPALGGLSVCVCGGPGQEEAGDGWLGALSWDFCLPPWLLSLALVKFKSRVNRRQKETKRTKIQRQPQTTKPKRKIEITDVDTGRLCPHCPGRASPQLSSTQTDRRTDIAYIQLRGLAGRRRRALGEGRPPRPALGRGRPESPSLGGRGWGL